MLLSPMKSALDLDELALHALAQLEVEGRERLVEEQDLRLVDDGACDGDALLLAARERRDVGVLIAVEVDELQRVLDLIADIGCRLALDLEAEGDVLRDIHVREQGILLEHRVDLPLLRRQLRDVLPVEQDAPLVRQLKAAYEAQCRRLATARRPQERQEFIFVNGQVQVLEDLTAAIELVDMLESQQFFRQFSLPHLKTT